ncbi:uncharacterized [Tachysurus ichikawai]
MAAPSYVHSDHEDDGPARPGLVSSTDSLSYSTTKQHTHIFHFPYIQTDEMVLEPQCRIDSRSRRCKQELSA